MVFFISLNSFLMDGIFGEISCFFLGDDAEYSIHFSTSGYRSLVIGQDEKEVIKIIGHPLLKVYWGEKNNRYSVAFVVNPKNGVGSVESVLDKLSDKIKIGQTEGEVEVQLGKPNSISWHYSRPKNGSHFRRRILVFKNGKLFEKIHEFYID